MHLFLSSDFLKSFNCKVVCLFILSVISLGITLADELVSPSHSSLPSYRARNYWNLKHSDPTRDGNFLNVPIYYGDWVPISSAKEQIESLASSVKTVPNKNRRKDEDLVTPSPILITDDLTSPVGSSLDVSNHHHHGLKQQINDAEERLDIDHNFPHHFIGPRLPNQQNHKIETNTRHINRPFNRVRSHYRGGNSRRKHRPTNSDALTRLFGPSLGWNGNRRRHRKIAQPQSPNSISLVDQITSIFGATPTQDTVEPQTTSSTGSSSLETIGNVFNFLPNFKGSSRPENHHGVLETSQTIFQPVVKLLPSPDLAEVSKSKITHISLFFKKISINFYTGQYFLLTV